MTLKLDTRALTRRPRVLVVEDEAEFRSILSDGLATAFETLTVPDGQAALELLNGPTRTPDVVLTDVSMPRMDGWELSTRLRADAHLREIPIVMLTGNLSREFRLKALEFGIDDFLLKPFDLTEVRLRLRNIARAHQCHHLVEGYAEHLESCVDERTHELQKALKELSGAEKDLRIAQAETVMKLAIACEYRDDDTAAHLHRMAGYSRVIAEELRLNEETVERIESAAPMHDIGKIGVPDSILLKPGRLSPEEFKVMQKHPGIGARILAGSSSPLLRCAELIALTHHEKFDGSGYPRGLVGTAIPIEGRIVALADVFDALTTKRCYKPAFSIEKSMSIINEGEGKHFDPAVVAAFKAGFERIVDICERLRDPDPVQGATLERTAAQG